jgi:hypothetical protein
VPQLDLHTRAKQYVAVDWLPLSSIFRRSRFSFLAQRQAIRLRCMWYSPGPPGMRRGSTLNRFFLLFSSDDIQPNLYRWHAVKYNLKRKCVGTQNDFERGVRDVIFSSPLPRRLFEFSLNLKMLTKNSINYLCRGAESFRKQRVTQEVKKNSSF